MSRSARTRAAALLAAVVALGLSACAPAMTINPYAPSDGTRVDLNDHLRGVNLLVVAGKEGGTGALQGAFVNKTADEQTFTLTVEGAAPVTVDVEAGETVYLGTEDGEDVTLDVVSKAPGNYLQATLEAGGETADFDLPILDGTLPEYESAVPQD